MIKHETVFDVVKLSEIYSERDGVPVVYVCTTDLRNSDVPADVFYRETPHPEFGNKYFGILQHNGQTYITNADIVESFDFGMVENDDGDLVYSISHHDYKSFMNGNMIDGGRQYIRSSVNAVTYVVRDGVFVEKEKLDLY